MASIIIRDNYNYFIDPIKRWREIWYFRQSNTYGASIIRLDVLQGTFAFNFSSAKIPSPIPFLLQCLQPNILVNKSIAIIQCPETSCLELLQFSKKIILRFVVQITVNIEPASTAYVLLWVSKGPKLTRMQIYILCSWLSLQFPTQRCIIYIAKYLGFVTLFMITTLLLIFGNYAIKRDNIWKHMKQSVNYIILLYLTKCHSLRARFALMSSNLFFLPIVQLATAFAVVVYLGNVTFITIVLIMLMNAILFELN